VSKQRVRSKAEKTAYGHTDTDTVKIFQIRYTALIRRNFLCTVWASPTHNI